MKKIFILTLLLMGAAQQVLYSQNLDCVTPPTCKFTYSIDPYGATVHFTGELGCNGDAVVSWDFDDGSPAVTGKSQEHVYDEEGAYLVKMTVSRPAPCQSVSYTYSDWVNISSVNPGSIFAELTGPTLAAQCQEITYRLDSLYLVRHPYDSLEKRAILLDSLGIKKHYPDTLFMAKEGDWTICFLFKDLYFRTCIKTWLNGAEMRPIYFGITRKEIILFKMIDKYNFFIVYDENSGISYRYYSFLPKDKNWNMDYFGCLYNRKMHASPPLPKPSDYEVLGYGKFSFKKGDSRTLIEHKPGEKRPTVTAVKE